MCDEQQLTINNIDFKDPKFTNKTQFTTNIGHHASIVDDKGTTHYKYVKVMEKDSKTGKLKVKLDENGNQIYKRTSNNEKIPVLEDVFEETPFVFNKWAGTTSAEHTPSEKRVSLKINHYHDQPQCEEIKNTFLKYDKLVEEKRKEILGHRDEMYSYVECVKIPDEDEDDENAKKYPKYPNSKLKLQMMYTYHNKHSGERFDEINERVISKAIRETLEDKNKSLDNLSIVLYEKNEESGKLEKKSYLYKDDIEDRCVIGTIVKFCKTDNVIDTTKKPWECNEDEIESLYGKLEQVDVKTPEDLDKYYTANCYVRYLFSPTKLWASKNKDATGKKKNFGIIFTCYQLHIIQIPNKKTDLSTGLSTKKKFETHTFGQKQLSSSQSQSQSQSLSRTESYAKPKEEPKLLKVDDSDEEQKVDGSDDASEKSGSGTGSESESESEQEQEPVKKKSSKTVSREPEPTPTPTKKITKKIVVEESEESAESSSSEEEVVVETKKKTTSAKATTKVLKK